MELSEQGLAQLSGEEGMMSSVGRGSFEGQ